LRLVLPCFGNNPPLPLTAPEFGQFGTGRIESLGPDSEMEKIAPEVHPNVIAELVTCAA